MERLEVVTEITWQSRIEPGDYISCFIKIMRGRIGLRLEEDPLYSIKLFTTSDKTLERVKEDFENAHYQGTRDTREQEREP